MKRPYKFLLAAAVLVAIIGIIAALYMYNLTDRDLQKVKPDFVITAGALLKAFSDDEAAASSKYINKIIEVTGTIESVKAGEENSLNVILGTGDPLSTIICTFQSGNDPAGFPVGEEITVRGECAGFLMDVLLNNCSVI